MSTLSHTSLRWCDGCDGLLWGLRLFHTYLHHHNHLLPNQTLSLSHPSLSLSSLISFSLSSFEEFGLKVRRRSDPGSDSKVQVPLSLSPVLFGCWETPPKIVYVLFFYFLRSLLVGLIYIFCAFFICVFEVVKQIVNWWFSIEANKFIDGFDAKLHVRTTKFIR